MRLGRPLGTVIAISWILPAGVLAQELTEGGRVIGFEPTTGVLIEPDSIATVRQGQGVAFSSSGGVALGVIPFDDRTSRGEWTIVRRGGIEVRYHNDDNMRVFGEAFFLDGREISPGYPVTSAAIDADGRVWVSLHAVSDAANRWRQAWKVYSSGGAELFALEAPSRETVIDARGDSVLFVRGVERTIYEVAIRRLSSERDNPSVIW